MPSKRKREHTAQDAFTISRDPTAAASTLSRDAPPLLTDLLQCPVCYEAMMPPIRQCTSGHTFCDTCSSKLISSRATAKCPICCVSLRNPLPRALVLEQLAGSSSVCCDLECGATFCYRDFEKHRSVCPLRVVACPSSRCSWSGLPQLLPAHLTTTHGLSAGAPSGPCRHFGPPCQHLHATVAFETRRCPTDKRPWRPARAVVSTRSQGGGDFLVSLWRPPGGSSAPLLACVQILPRAPRSNAALSSSDATPTAGGGSADTVAGMGAGGGAPWAAAVELRRVPAHDACGARVIVEAECTELADGHRDAWLRPECPLQLSGPALVVPACMVPSFNAAAALEPTVVRQRYELRLTFTPAPLQTSSGRPQGSDLRGSWDHTGGDAGYPDSSEFSSPDSSSSISSSSDAAGDSSSLREDFGEDEEGSWEDEEEGYADYYSSEEEEEEEDEEEGGGEGGGELIPAELRAALNLPLSRSASHDLHALRQASARGHAGGGGDGDDAGSDAGSASSAGSSLLRRRRRSIRHITRALGPAAAPLRSRAGTRSP